MGQVARSTPSRAVLGAIQAVCLSFAAVGLLVAVAGSTVLFAPWRDAAATALFARPRLPPSLEPFVALTNGILGGSIVGKWLAASWLVRNPLAEGRRWAWNALMVGLLAWFLLDSTMSLSLGATFNVWMINLAPLVIFGGLLLRARRFTSRTPPPDPAPSAAWAALRWICLGMAIFGVVVALASHTALFGMYQQAIADSWFQGSLQAEAITWLRFSYALIGATFLGHFLMLGLALHYAPGERWALDAVVISMIGWFLVDATASASHDAWFNVWMIDVPSLLAVLIPWWFASRILRRDPP